jgi:hypothetical protein
MGRAGAKAAFLARPLHRANGCAPGGGEWRKSSRICGEFAPAALRTVRRAPRLRFRLRDVRTDLLSATEVAG